jgi:hypothetical protein
MVLAGHWTWNDWPLAATVMPITRASEKQSADIFLMTV